MISFILPIKDRDKKRIVNCVKSLKSDITGEIIIIDYGSKKPLENISGARIIRYNKNKIWNKAHAINLGIKVSKYDYISTVDCDMIIHPDFIETVKMHLSNNSFIYSLNVKRIETKHVCGDFKSIIGNSTPWFGENLRKNISHTANGGIQIYPKKWISNICGVDESLVYWGAIDNDTFERAIMCGLTMVNINKPILHQEHKFKKEENLPAKERSYAFVVRVEKVKYLDKMFKYNKYIRNAGKWGLKKPNQNRFIRDKTNIEREGKKLQEEERLYTERFINAIKLEKESFEFNGKTIKVYK